MRGMTGMNLQAVHDLPEGLRAEGHVHLAQYAHCTQLNGSNALKIPLSPKAILDSPEPGVALCWSEGLVRDP